MDFNKNQWISVQSRLDRSKMHCWPCYFFFFLYTAPYCTSGRQILASLRTPKNWKYSSVPVHIFTLQVSCTYNEKHIIAYHICIFLFNNDSGQLQVQVTTRHWRRRFFSSRIILKFFFSSRIFEEFQIIFQLTYYLFLNASYASQE